MFLDFRLKFEKSAYFCVNGIWLNFLLVQLLIRFNIFSFYFFLDKTFCILNPPDLSVIIACSWVPVLWNQFHQTWLELDKQKKKKKMCVVTRNLFKGELHLRPNLSMFSKSPTLFWRKKYRHPYYNFSRPSGSWLIDKNVPNIVGINNSRTA